jgi:hypothetical protein
MWLKVSSEVHWSCIQSVLLLRELHWLSVVYDSDYNPLLYSANSELPNSEWSLQTLKALASSTWAAVQPNIFHQSCYGRAHYLVVWFATTTGIYQTQAECEQCPIPASIQVSQWQTTLRLGSWRKLGRPSLPISRRRHVKVICKWERIQGFWLSLKEDLANHHRHLCTQGR